MEQSVKAALQTLVAQAQRDQADYLASLSDAERAAFGEPDHWSARDHINHNNFWRARLVQIFEAMRTRTPPPTITDSEAANQGAFAAARGLEWEAILAESDRLYAAIDAGLAARSEEDLTDPARYYLPNAGALQGRVIHFAYEHPLSHYVQLLRERGDHAGAIAKQQEAITLTEQLFGRGEAYFTVLYNLGCLYAVIGQPEQALATLRDALTSLPPEYQAEWRKTAREDAELVSLRDLPEFQTLTQA